MNKAQMCALIQQNSHLLGAICKTHYEHETCKQTQKQMRYYAVCRRPLTYRGSMYMCVGCFNDVH